MNRVFLMRAGPSGIAARSAVLLILMTALGCERDGAAQEGAPKRAPPDVDRYLRDPGQLRADQLENLSQVEWFVVAGVAAVLTAAVTVGIILLYVPPTLKDPKPFDPQKERRERHDGLRYF